MNARAGQRVRFPSNGHPAEGYLTLPPSGSGPGLVVIQEWWGLVEHIRDVCERFAAEGFVALAPDLYHGITTEEPDEAFTPTRTPATPSPTTSGPRGTTPRRPTWPGSRTLRFLRANLG